MAMHATPWYIYGGRRVQHKRTGKLQPVRQVCVPECSWWAGRCYAPAGQFNTCPRPRPHPTATLQGRGWFYLRVGGREAQAAGGRAAGGQVHTYRAASAMLGEGGGPAGTVGACLLARLGQRACHSRRGRLPPAAGAVLQRRLGGRLQPSHSSCLPRSAPPGLRTSLHGLQATVQWGPKSQAGGPKRPTLLSCVVPHSGHELHPSASEPRRYSCTHQPTWRFVASRRRATSEKPSGNAFNINGPIRSPLTLRRTRGTREGGRSEEDGPRTVAAIALQVGRALAPRPGALLPDHPAGQARRGVGRATQPRALLFAASQAACLSCRAICRERGGQ